MRKGPGLSSTRPTNEATPLGQPTRPKARPSASTPESTSSVGDALRRAGVVPEPEATPEIAAPASNSVDDASPTPVASSVQASSDATPKPEISPMLTTFTIDTKTRKSNSVVFTADNKRGSVRFAKTLFDGDPPASISIDANFKDKPKPRAKMTKEERKALPKLTPAQRLAKLEERSAALRKKIAAETPAAQ